MKGIQGLIAAAYPPLDKNGNLNLGAIESYVDFLVKNKVDGVFLNGSTGDFASLTIDERKLIVEEWIRYRPQGFELMVHVGDTNVNQSIELARHAAKLGVDAISSLSPYYYKPASIQELVHICKEIAAASPDTPFYYYHIPVLTGVNFDMVQFIELAGQEIPNFGGLKYTQEDLMQFKCCLDLENEKYDILFGVDEILVCGLALGAKGAVGSTYNHLTPVFHKIIEAFKNGEIDRAHKLQHQVMVFVKTLAKYGFHPASKAVLGLLGLDLGPVRLPLRNLTSQEKGELENELTESGILELVYSTRFST